MTDIQKILQATDEALHPLRGLHAQIAPALAIQKQLAPIFELQRAIAPALAIQKQLAPILEMQKAIAPALAIQNQLKPILDLQQQWKGLVIPTPSWALAFRNAALDITKAAGPILELQKSIAPLAGLFSAMARTSAECQAIEDAGWLPHYTTPFDVLAGAEAEDFDQLISTHYRVQWVEVKAAFMARLAASPLDAEAKAAFVDALAAHEAGMYRATSRILFPEIERVARKEFHGLSKGQTSQRALKKAAENLALSDVEPGGMYAFRLFEKLFDHLYARTETPDELAEVALDPVPNRHAALHGFLPYDTAKNSINMLVMADFLFQVICALKAQRHQDCSSEAASVPDVLEVQ